MRERSRKRRSCLDRWISNLANIIALIKTKNSFFLIEGYALGYLENIRIELLNILCIQEYMGLLRLEPKCNDIFDIINSHFLDVFQSFLLSENKFFIVGDLDDQGHIKSLLQVLSEHHRNRMPKVKCLRRWPSSCVQIEVIFLFVSVKYHV